MGEDTNIYLAGRGGTRVAKDGWNWWGTLFPLLWLSVKGLPGKSSMLGIAYIGIPLLAEQVLGITDVSSLASIFVVLNIVAGLIVGKLGWGWYISSLAWKGYREIPYAQSGGAYNINPLRIIVRGFGIAVVVGSVVMYLIALDTYKHSRTSRGQTLYEASQYWQMDSDKHPYTIGERIQYATYIVKTGIPQAQEDLKTIVNGQPKATKQVRGRKKEVITAQPKSYPNWIRKLGDVPLFWTVSLIFFPFGIIYSAYVEHYGWMTTTKYAVATATIVLLVLLILMMIMGRSQRKEDYSHAGELF